MSSPRVSVVLPVFRASPGEYRLAVRSILEQSLSELELLLIENGPIDESVRRISREFAARDARVRILHRDVADVALAFNAGIEAARAPCIARMDADDVSHRRRLELQLAWLERRPRVDVLGTRVRFASRLERADGFRRFVEWQNRLLTHREITLGMCVEATIVNPSVMFRRRALERVGGCRAGNFPEDYDLWLRMLEAGAVFAKLPQRLLLWRDHPGRLTRTDARYAEGAFHACKAGFLARWIERRTERAERPVYIWGAGRNSRRYAHLLQAEGVAFTGHIDIDPRKIGRSLKGAPVFAPNILEGELRAGRRPFVISYVAGERARTLIGAELRKLGFRASKDFLFAS